MQQPFLDCLLTLLKIGTSWHVTGHRNAASLTSYCQPTSSQRAEMAAILDGKNVASPRSNQVALCATSSHRPTLHSIYATPRLELSCEFDDIDQALEVASEEDLRPGSHGCKNFASALQRPLPLQLKILQRGHTHTFSSRRLLPAAASLENSPWRASFCFVSHCSLLSLVFFFSLLLSLTHAQCSFFPPPPPPLSLSLS